jgi:hypothetical protein
VVSEAADFCLQNCGDNSFECRINYYIFGLG